MNSSLAEKDSVEGCFFAENSFDREVKGVFYLLQEGKSMKVSPDFEEVRRIAESGRYNVLPVSCEILSDILTPIEAVRILKNISSHCFMLESAEEKEKWGRYTFLGFDPKMEIGRASCRERVCQYV